MEAVKSVSFRKVIEKALSAYTKLSVRSLVDLKK